MDGPEFNKRLLSNDPLALRLECTALSNISKTCSAVTSKACTGYGSVCTSSNMARELALSQEGIHNVLSNGSHSNGIITDIRLNPGVMRERNTCRTLAV